MMRSIGYFLITAFICTLAIELYIRGTEISGVSETDYDKEIGRVIRPNAKIVHYNENFTYSQVNKYGYLGPSYSPDKAPGIFRVALLGDSYVEGFQVLERHHFRTILEEELRENLKYDSVEILNFGRSGFGLADAYAYDLNFVSEFDPDLKVYLLSAIDFYKSSGDELLPKWKLKGEELIQDTSYRSSKELKLYNTVKVGLQHSATLQMLRNCVNIIRDGKAMEVLLGKLSKLFIDSEVQPLHDNEKRKKLVKEELPQIPDVILEKLGKQKDVIIANRDSIQFPQHLQQEITQANIKLVNLSDTLSPLKQDRHLDPRYWPVTNTKGHWNYRAHQAVGEYLTKILVKQINTESLELGYKK
ncbi:SGNH/GDSL hydrolase family protein [Catalinimonas sp. 4WD22]|uniref:SGNH/GDSL hydrolase family protein n=1 Tax=Catalinimonas locisalis TaxID=3133978 RepID=UPI003101A2AB